jgi:phospho-N-acetylmuramoyl-pentapeptide-transferase
MIFYLFTYLVQTLHWKIPTAFFYVSTRMILASLTALVLSIFLGPLWIKKLYEWKIGQQVRSVAEVPLLAKLHSNKKNTPTMGGTLILFSMVLSLFLWMDLTHVFTWIFLFVTLVLGGLGAWDDFLKLRFQTSKGLKARFKLLTQLVVSGLIAFYLLSGGNQSVEAKEMTFPKKTTTLSMEEYMEKVYIPFYKDPICVCDGWLKVALFLFFICVITGSSNAVNLTDGLDGLAAGCLVMVSCVLAIFAFFSNHIDLARYLNILYIEGSGEIAIYLMALAGASLGFLWYNGYPAQVFMGDTGSLALGGILGVAAVLLRREGVLAIAGAVFVAEALSVILQVLSYRYRNKKRIFLCAPLHHHFEYKGWPETKVVLRFWIVSLFFAIIAISSLKLQ